MTPDPNCSNCNGTGKMAAIALDIHGDGQHDCFCTTYDQGPQHPEDMTREEVNTEILEWREGRLYRGYDRYLAEQVPGLKAEIQRLNKVEAELLSAIEVIDKQSKAYLEDLQRLQAAQEWRPISTAPRDGTPIWTSDGTDCQEAWFSEGFWWIRKDTVLAKNAEPKFWLPLPLPPKFEDSKEVKG
jgi:hypothetical protein